MLIARAVEGSVVISHMARTAPAGLNGHAIGGAAARITADPAPVIPQRTSIPRFEFSTRELPRKDQFAAWRQSFATMLDFAEPSDTAAGFAGTQVIWDLGDLALAEVSTDGLDFTSLAGHIRRDPIDHWLVTLIQEGRSQTITPSRSFDGDAGSVQVHPLGGVFEGSVTDSEMLLLFVPRDFCRDMGWGLDAAEFSVLRGGMGPLFVDYLTSLAQRLPTMDVGDLPDLLSATRAMLHGCIAPYSDLLAEAHDQISATLLERARRFVQRHLFEPDLSIEQMTRELGISRSRLYRLFEASGGVVHYIQHRRLLAAHAALADPNDRRRILDIADEYGFCDGAEFSRAFRRAFGYCPSEVRTGVKNGPSNWHVDEVQAAAPVQRLGQLLHRLQA
ncbi:AraC family transcriptional regulator [Mesorhizobium qingshengii]|uniref:AraC family transcriptional regulator n=1 Tax=Mesorhizobium qingshengii TaxID=1165689 RepID=A0ABT4R330_9HYPH|nr:AraC family transcriptional regulator [Mesorhizobium qingshengii]MCZ8548243.1 AraC family transcriptional regulator [Mesorhizobium qingshengii]